MPHTPQFDLIVKNARVARPGKTDVKQMDIGITAGKITALENDLAADSAKTCLLYTSPSPRDQRGSRMPSSA